MNSFLKISAFFFSLVVLFSFVACTTSDVDETKLAYQSGEILSKNIIKYYFIASDEMDYTNNYQLELAGLLSANEDSIEIEHLTLVEDADEKIKIFTEYISLLQELQKDDQANKNVNLKMFSLLNVLDSTKLCSVDTLTMIKEYISANQYSEEVAVNEITTVIYKIWQEDVFSWQAKLNKAYNNYANLIDNIPAEVFDEDKLEKFVYEPYEGKETLVKIYKLNMKQEAYESKSVFLDRTIFLMETFLDLSGIYFQLSQSNPDAEYVDWVNEQVYNSLKTFEQNN